MTDLPPQTPNRKIDGAAIKAWLAAPLTVTFPGWVFAAAGLGGLILLLIALD
jgi:hypothetical protein